MFISGLLCTAKATNGVRHHLIFANLLMVAVNAYSIVTKEAEEAGK